MVEDDGGFIVGESDVVDAIVGEFVAVFFKVMKGKRVKGDELAGNGVEKREHSRATGEVRVLDVFQETGDDKFLDRVLNLDTIRDGVRDKGVVGVARGDGDGTKDKSGGGRMGKDVWRSGGVEVVYDIVGVAIKLKLVDGEGQVIGSWEAEGRIGRWQCGIYSMSLTARTML